MATISPNWTRNVAVTMSGGASVAASGNSTGNIDLNALTGDMTVIQISLTAGAAGTCTVSLFGSADDGTTIDDNAFQAYTVASGETDIRTIQVIGRPYIRIQLDNNDGSNSVTSVDVQHAWRNWSSV